MANNNNKNGKNVRKKDEITCIQLSKETRDKLAELGKKKDTFESIIVNLMDDKPCGENMVGESESE